MTGDSERFVKLFDDPSVDKMYALSPTEFERFVEYVLQRAGYTVKHVGPHWLRGVDVEMRQPGKTRIFGGVECKRFATTQLVTAPMVKGVKGAPVVSKPGAKPFIVTTSDYNDAAHKMAKEGTKQVYLLNGSQLVRYIRYIQGSRYNDADVIATLSPEFFAGRESTRLRSVGKTRILAVANNKGGVGKTTTAYYLGVEFARRGKRVLMIDLDGQGNLTERCIPNQLATLHQGGGHLFSIVHYFAGQHSLQNLVISAEGTPGLSLIPSDPFLTLRDLGGTGRPDIELQFVADVRRLCMHPIASLSGTPDWIILDTAPAMSVFTRAALATAEYVLAPIRPRPASLAGTGNMLDTVQTMNALMGTDANFLGVVVTHWDDLKLSRDFVEVEVPPRLLHLGGQVFAAMIPIDNQLESVEPGAKTRGAQAYGDLADEVLRRVQLKPVKPVKPDS